MEPGNRTPKQRKPPTQHYVDTPAFNVVRLGIPSSFTLLYGTDREKRGEKGSSPLVTMG